jgi:hypothetical protein
VPPQLDVLRWIVPALAPGVAAMALAGCAAGVRSAAAEAPRVAVPVVVDESLKSLEDTGNRERIDRILATPEMQGVIRDAAGSATRGAIAGAAEEREVMVGAIDEAVGVATRTAVRSVAAESPETLTPAMREALVSTLTSPDVRAALDGLTAEATRTALLSSRDVIVQLHEESEGPGLVAKLQRVVVGSLVAALVLGASACGLLAWALRLRVRTRELRELSSR